MVGFRLVLAAVLFGICWGGAARAGGIEDDSVLAKKCVAGNIVWSVAGFDAKNSVIAVRVAGVSGIYDGVVRETSIASIAEHFGVRVAQDLAGKTFAAPCKKARDGKLVDYDDPLDVLDLLGVQRMYDGHYVPPTDEVLYRRTVQTFAQMRLPDFSDVDRRTLWHAFERLYDAGGKGSAVFVDRLARDVFAASKGTVSLLRTNRQDLCAECRAHLRLMSKDGALVRLVIGPYPDPVVAEPD